MSQVATMTARKREEAPGPDYCTYASVKLDDRLVHLAKAVAALRDVPLQEFISDVVNEAVARELGRQPIKRRAAPPKGSPPRKGKRPD